MWKKRPTCGRCIFLHLLMNGQLRRRPDGYAFFGHTKTELLQIQEFVFFTEMSDPTEKTLNLAHHVEPLHTSWFFNFL